MKLINKLILGVVAVVAMAATGCSDDTPSNSHFESKDVDFNYNVADDSYKLDYYVVSHIQFNNISSKSGAVTWDFGDGTTSNAPNPVHKFDKAGVYRVTLTVEGVGSVTYPILIYDIAPVLSIDTQTDEIVEFGKSLLTFKIELPNPEDLRVRYEWRFPEGTTLADGTPLKTFTGYSENGTVDYPEAVKFANIGSQRVELSTWFDLDGENRRLEDVAFNVQVGTQEAVPTIYYAQKGGNIKALKLVDPATLPAGTKNYPFDMGVSAGNTARNLVYANKYAEDDEGQYGWVYILDCGKQYSYINDIEGALGDGYINVMRTDGTNVNTVISNVGGAAFLDPYVGAVVNDYLYYTDRGTGVSRVSLSTRGAVQGKYLSGDTYLRDDYVIKNELVPYYGRGISYGAANMALQRDSKGNWWWTKGFNGFGILVFNDSQVYNTQKEAEAADLPRPVVLPNINCRSMVMDETNGYIYVWYMGVPQGFRQYAVPAANESGDALKPLLSVNMDCANENSTADETLNVTQLALDKNTGKVYFCFRPTATDTSGIPAGVCCFDPATGKVTHFGDGNDLGLGICINPNPSKLF